MVVKQEPGTWDYFVGRARDYLVTGKLKEEELDYKEDIGRALTEIREFVLRGDDVWLGKLLTVNRRYKGNPVYWQIIDNFNDWCRETHEKALEALQLLWADDDSTTAERITAFRERMPESVSTSGASRMALISYLLMGLDVYRYPLFKYTEVNMACELANFERPVMASDENTYYAHTLRFLNRFIREARKRGVKLNNCLEAQSVAWSIANNMDNVSDVDVDDDPPLAPFDLNDDALQDLADTLYLPTSFLEEIQTLLEEKKQVIFQGPPGTGKTLIARDLAWCLAGKNVTLVQFHPSYAYEDFVQGYRPTILKNRQPGFELRDGPLLKAAKRAEEVPAASHYLIIDEINRGNLAKVLGELYFLLEYRDQEINLQYSDEPFSLPDNLYIIGTMNTADRSIARVDMALRRRFYFVEFHPDDEPVKSVLRLWIKEWAPKMEWVADVVDKVNEKLKDDRHAAIGPSYFMKEEGLNEAAVERIWKHSVLPYIEERRFGGDEGDIKPFDLKKLKTEASKGNGEEDGDNADSNE